jgi:hypothetical protein
MKSPAEGQERFVLEVNVEDSVDLAGQHRAKCLFDGQHRDQISLVSKALA